MTDVTDVTDELPGFSEPTRAWFAAAFARPTPAQVGAWARDRRGPARAGGRADRLRQDAVGVPVVARPAGRDRAGPDEEASAAGSSTSRRSRRSRSTSSATCAPRWPASGTPPTGSAPRSPEIRSASGPATPRRPTGAGCQTTPPDILITTPESLFLMLTSQARESLRGVETVIVDEVHAVAGTKRGAHLALSLERLDELLERPGPADRPVGDGAPGRGGGPVPRRLRARRGGGAAVGEEVGPQGRRAGRGHDRARRRGGGADGSAAAGVASWPHVEERVVDLIEQHRSTIVFANSRRLAERLTARLNEIAAERRRWAWLDEPRPTVGAHPGRDDGPDRPVRGRRTAGRPRPPRLGLQGAAGPHRGRPQARPAALRGRHQQPRARHRHGRGRPGRPDRVAAVGGQRAAAGRPRRPPGRRGLARGAVPQAPRRPGADGGRGRADAHAAASRRCTCRPTRSTCSPSRSSPPPRSTPGTPTTCSTVVRRAAPFATLPRSRVRRDARPARPAATRATSSPSCAPGSSGTGSPAS